jgi:hypothetical protein
MVSRTVLILLVLGGVAAAQRQRGLLGDYLHDKRVAKQEQQHDDRMTEQAEKSPRAGSGPKPALDDVQMRTDRRWNGRYWQWLDDSEKLIFLIGFTEGAGWIKGITYVETRTGVNQFYMDAANARIPVKSAMAIFKMKLEGATPAEINEKTAELRRQVANLDGEKPAEK